MPGIFVKGPWHSTFIIAKYGYSTQKFFAKLKFTGKCKQSLRSTLYITLLPSQIAWFLALPALASVYNSHQDDK